jgi:hypothetical protein
LPGDPRADSGAGLWYRISEWINTESWGSLLASGRLQEFSVLIGLFYQIASTLAVVHDQGHFIPHLIPKLTYVDRLKRRGLIILCCAYYSVSESRLL